MSREAIVNVLSMYGAVLDAHQWDLFDGIFAQDVEADYPGVLHWFDLKTFKRDFASYHESLDNHQHYISNQQVLVRGDRANSLSYSIYRLAERGTGEEAGNVRHGSAWYDDELILTSAGWRIRKRVARVFWALGGAPARETMPGAGIQRGATSSLIEEANAGRVAYFNALKQVS